MSAWRRTSVIAALPGWDAVYNVEGTYILVPVAAWVTDESDTLRSVTAPAVMDGRGRVVWAETIEGFVNVVGPGEDRPAKYQRRAL